MSGTGSIYIRAPEQVDFRNPEVVLNPRELHPWLEDLPPLRPLLTIRKILESIEILNTQKTTAKIRLQLLQLYRHHALAMFPSLETDSLKRLSIKELDRSTVQDQSIRLYLAIADGYKIVLRDALREGKIQQPDDFLMALYHAMEMLSLVLVSSFRYYRNVPANTFNDLHQLYLLVEHQNTQQMDVSISEPGLANEKLGFLYLQIIALSALNPFKLPQGFATRLYQELRRLSQHCTLSRQVPKSGSAETFIVDLGKDDAPLATHKESSDKKHDLPRLLDLGPMIKKVRAELTTLDHEAGAADKNDRKALLEKLVPPSIEEQTRKAERAPTVRNCKVTFGIDAVYHFLTLDQDQLEKTLQAQNDSFGFYALETWVILNESTTGYMLASQQMTQNEIRVGDIIGLLNEDTGNMPIRGLIAIIRWMRTQEDQQVHIGVEIIPGNILPASCHILEEGLSLMGTNNPYRGIFISSVPVLKQSASILMPKKVFRRGRKLEITIDQHPMTIKAGFLVEDTFTFDRFDFESIQS